MLHPKDFDAWLDCTGGKDLLDHPPPELREWIVNSRMNNAKVGDDDPATAEPVEPESDSPPSLKESPPQGSLF